MAIVMSTDWIPSAIDAINGERIQHQSYKRAQNDLFQAIASAAPGEVVLLIGPMRAGKSRVLNDAVRMAFGPQDAGSEIQPCVIVEAENSGPSGEFSTKAFMREALTQIRHPVYGVAADDDVGGLRLDLRINKTAESVMRKAFENYLGVRRTRVLAIDEAHHVKYVKGGNLGAERVLNSWKCLANKTRVVLVLVGSYELLRLIALAPHFAGRKNTIEFPRYRVDVKDDVVAFEEVLRCFDQYLCFSDSSTSLRKFNKLLFVESLGCIGNLSLWLRSALARAKSRGISALTKELLLDSRKPKIDLVAMEQEILAGEMDMRQEENAVPERGRQSGTKKPLKPFRTKNTRHARGGRS